MTGEEFLYWLHYWLSNAVPKILEQPPAPQDPATPWWEIVSAFSPLGAGLGAIAAAWIAFSGVRKKTQLDAWWQRAEWALNLAVSATSSDSERDAGLKALEALSESGITGAEEKDFLNAVGEQLKNEGVDAVDGGEEGAEATAISEDEGVPEVDDDGVVAPVAVESTGTAEAEDLQGAGTPAQVERERGPISLLFMRLMGHNGSKNQDEVIADEPEQTH